MTVDDSTMQKLWKLTNELTAQLVFNRNAALELKQQLADLKAKVAQESVSITQTGQPYSAQEHADLSLRIANERLTEENLQLQEQVREYERWMEYIMAKFRLQNFAMAQSRKEAMHEAYRMAEQEEELAARLREENSALQARLVNVGAIARKAIDEEYYNAESIIETLELENQGLREMLGVATENMNPVTAQQSANRVSFPSTNSYMASSGSDQELQRGNDLRANSYPPSDVASSPTVVPSPPQLVTDSHDKSTRHSAMKSTTQETTDDIANKQASIRTQGAQEKPVSTTSKTLASKKSVGIGNNNSSDSGKGGVKTNANTGSKKSSRTNNVTSTSGNNHSISSTNNNNSLGDTRTKKTSRKQKT
ncbi:hypothetical protein BGZ51_009523 [Haplosporangium sp. Z 767]|nr:hypothetical protein BGZ51_009523 [Haplosporangium sp. Z 767]